MVSIRRNKLLKKRNGGQSSINSHSCIIGSSSTTYVVDTVVSRVNGNNVDNGNMLNDDIVGGNDVDTTLRITTTTIETTTIVANTTTNNVEKPERRGRKKTNKKRKEPESNRRKETNKKRKRTNCRVIDVNKPPPPEVPVHLQGIIQQHHGAEAVPCFVMEKTLPATDINSKQGRLLFPTKKIHFKDEHCWVEADTSYEKEIECKRRNVRVLDPEGVWHDEIELRIWKSGCGENIYVLTGKSSWNQLVKSNGFKAGDVIIVWSFKIEEKNNVGNGDRNRPEICFVIARKEKIRHDQGTTRSEQDRRSWDILQ